MKIEVKSKNTVMMTDLEYGDPFYYEGFLHIRTMNTNAVRLSDGYERKDLNPATTKITRARVKVVLDVSE